MTGASKPIRILSVKFYVIRTMCRTAFFHLSLPSCAVTLSELQFYQCRMLFYQAYSYRFARLWYYTCLFLTSVLRSDSSLLNGQVVVDYTQPNSAFFRPTQPSTLSGTENEYESKCNDSLRLGSTVCHGYVTSLLVDKFVGGRLNCVGSR